jgi:hypothetical protein
MSDREYEFVQGSPEQIEVFLDLQRLLVKMYNKWPGDTAIAVFAAALGSAAALIEVRFEHHMEECEVCREEYKDVMLDLADVAQSNLAYYYDMQIKQADEDKEKADNLVKSFFRGV